MLDKLWDDVVAGPQPDRGLGRLRRNTSPTKPAAINIIGDSVSQSYKTSYKLVDLIISIFVWVLVG